MSSVLDTKMSAQEDDPKTSLMMEINAFLDACDITTFYEANQYAGECETEMQGAIILFGFVYAHATLIKQKHPELLDPIAKKAQNTLALADDSNAGHLLKDICEGVVLVLKENLTSESL